jgi:hypothetical protein
MFIALYHISCALQRSAMCFGAFRYMPLLTERETLGIWGYKHVAPPEQEPSISMMTTFRAKLLSMSVAGRYQSMMDIRF